MTDMMWFFHFYMLTHCPKCGAPRTKSNFCTVALPIKWHYPDTVAARYATNLVVQKSEHECFISFFEMKPPVLLGTPEEIEAELKKMGSITAECVARVVIAPSRWQNSSERCKGYGYADERTTRGRTNRRRGELNGPSDDA